tara:strand:- start:1407 stop:1736 length:330 start_codon:yes stop_codon:yes gene_type:complete
MEKPALRTDRYVRRPFMETKWTMSSNSLGEYIFRRLSLDQSDKNLCKVRPRHQLSNLIVTSKEINEYVNDYLAMMDLRRDTVSDEINVSKSDSISSDSFQIVKNLFPNL